MIGGSPTTSAVPRLWPHQLEAVDLACKTLEEGGRATLVLACGSGKTRIGAHAAAALAPVGRRLVLAPTVTLVAQLVREYRTALGDAVAGRLLAVCSEAIHGAGQAGIADLEALRIPVTTAPGEIARAVWGPGPVTVFSTYHSVVALARAHRDHGMAAWDVAVMDEAHRTVNGGVWSRVHDDEYLPARRRLYMTATPRQVCGGSSAADVVGMDDERVFGPTIYRLGYASAIELGLLAPYRFVVSVVTDDDIRALTDETEHRTSVRVGNAMIPARMLAAQISVLRAAQDHGVRRAISYHSSVSDARHFAATLPRVAGLAASRQRVWAEHLCSDTPGELREARLRRLGEGIDGGLALISNARLLAEGVDVPAVDAVMFASPRHSSVDIIQAIGRAVRRGEDPDKVATIIVPLLIEPGADPISVLDTSAYAPVWRVVRALRSHDDDLAAELDQLRRQGAAIRRAPEDAGEGVGRRLPWLHVDGGAVTGRFIEAIAIRVIESATARWEEFYGAAVDYRDQHGDLLVPQTWVTDSGLGLGQWLHTQRVLYDRGKLRPDRIRLLEALGMVWSVLDAAWESGLAAAAAYKARHGDLDVPQRYVTDDGFKLGHWINLQRTNHSKGKLSADRTRRLEELGITWKLAEARRNAAWERALAAATAYYRHHQHLNVPRDYVDSNGFRLGKWLNNIRSKQDRLTADRRAALTAVGMTWTDIRDLAWERGYAAAAEFRRRNGHLNVPDEHVTSDGYRLGQWIVNQRRRCRNEERRRRLDELGMIWSIRQARWEQALAHAAAYVRDHGHLHPPVSYITPDGFRLGIWLSNRRVTGRITPEQRAQLDALDPTWADSSIAEQYRAREHERPAPTTDQPASLPDTTHNTDLRPAASPTTAPGPDTPTTTKGTQWPDD